jgi:very-short-patch-repair endonuclease
LRARELRNAASPAERKLWHHLSRRQVNGAKFSRQIPVEGYICDFICRARRLIVEIDGESHDSRLEHDAVRTQRLVGAGYRVIRFTNADVYERIEGVLSLISDALEALPTPNPSRMREGNPSI